MNSTSGAPFEADEYRETLVALCGAMEGLRQRDAAALGIAGTELAALELVCDGDGLTPSRIASDLGITPGSVTPILDHLAEAGYIRRSPDPSDGRRYVITAKPGGQHALAWTRDNIDTALNDAVMDHSTAADRKVLTTLLGRTVEAIAETNRTRRDTGM